MTTRDMASTVLENLRDPKTYYSHTLAILAVIFLYCFLYLYQDIIGIPLSLINFDQLLDTPWVRLVILPVAYIGYVKADPLLHGTCNNPCVRSYRRRLPSLYLIQRCNRCVHSKSGCTKRVTPEHAADVWFGDIFGDLIRQHRPDRVRSTFERGYRCKLVYGLVSLSAALAVASTVLLLGRLAAVHFLELSSLQDVALLPADQVLFPLVMALLAMSLLVINRPRPESPTGCWKAWQEICEMHIAWMERNQPFLDQVVCKNADTGLSYQE